jgi:hypothetical protein
MLAKRIDHTIRSHDNPLKTNAQRQSYSRNPFDAVLYSHRVASAFYAHPLGAPHDSPPVH